MRLTPEDGLRSAKKLASEKWDDYQLALRTYGNTINQFLGHLPKSIAIGHLLRVNPALEAVLPITGDRRRGFMYATFEGARIADIAWEDLDDPTTCAYIWGRDINDASSWLYTNNVSVFTSPDEDFWRCAYLAHVLGQTTFSLIWTTRDTLQPTAYGSLISRIDNLRKSLPGWPIIKLKKTVFVDCAFVFEIAKRGGSLVSIGYGIQPIPNQNQIMQIFVPS